MDELRLLGTKTPSVKEPQADSCQIQDQFSVSFDSIAAIAKG